MYYVDFTDNAKKGLAKLKKSEPKSFQKVIKLLDELQQHPKTGTGKPEQLKGNCKNQWSRRITDKHRLIYEIREEGIVVIVISSYGHYEDK
ncbi:MAG: Txe/YoeB family addiction module toxin [Bacteroidales bacterium]|nr:Txe/YoeB family addiction module toxin [Bacteroidales bacterium]